MVVTSSAGGSTALLSYVTTKSDMVAAVGGSIPTSGAFLQHGGALVIGMSRFYSFGILMKHRGLTYSLLYL